MNLKELKTRYKDSGEVRSALNLDNAPTDLKIYTQEFSAEEFGEFFTAWYIDEHGYRSEHHNLNPVPIRVKDCPEELDPKHPKHIGIVHNILKHIRRTQTTDSVRPLPPLVGHNGKGIYFIFDGNHEMCGLHAVGQAVKCTVIEHPEISRISTDFELVLDRLPVT